MIQLPQTNSTIYSRPRQTHETHIYLSGEITNPEDYTEILQALNEAQEGDNITIHMNSGGGQVRTAMQIVNAIRQTKAVVTGSLEAECHSAMTYIFLSCDQWLVHPNSLMLIHNYSGGNYGKGYEGLEATKNIYAWITKIMQDVYKGFLTEDEIKTVCSDKDIWLHSEEIMSRLDKVVEMREEAAERAEAEQEEALLEKLLEQVDIMKGENQDGHSEDSDGVQESSTEQ